VLQAKENNRMAIGICKETEEENESEDEAADENEVVELEDCILKDYILKFR
jgi:hypothetical protein